MLFEENIAQIIYGARDVICASLHLDFVYGARYNGYSGRVG
jgi:hypothetical protein